VTEEPAVELGVGFADDDVVVLLDGQEVWRRQGVSTNYSVGIADVVHLPGPGTLEVRVRDHVLSGRVGPDMARLRVDLDPSGAPRLHAAPEGPVF
jgi:hypothetical protein